MAESENRKNLHKERQLNTERLIDQVKRKATEQKLNEMDKRVEDALKRKEEQMKAKQN